MDSNNSSEFEAHLLATQLATAAALPAALKCAIELGLLELIKKAGAPGTFISAADLAVQIPATNPAAPSMLDRILHLLASYSVLNCSLKSHPDGGVERLYSLAPVCEFLTKNDDGVSLAPLFLLDQDKVLKSMWDKLKDSVVDDGGEGIPAFKKAYGMSIYEYMERDERLNKVFNEAMFNHSMIIMKKILETYDGFEGLKSMVDVGGGIGAALNMIISKYPSIKAINFDLPNVIQNAPSYTGVEYIAGDMFVSVPKGDAIFMKSICHNWSDEDCVKLLKNCYKAIPENGKVILVELIMPKAPDKKGLSTKSVLHFDMSMMTILGGKERTKTEFQVLAKGAGFKEFHKVCRAYNFWTIELKK